jgi:hypothetical protein
MQEEKMTEERPKEEDSKEQKAEVIIEIKPIEDESEKVQIFTKQVPDDYHESEHESEEEEAEVSDHGEESKVSYVQEKII